MSDKLILIAVLLVAACAGPAPQPDWRPALRQQVERDYAAGKMDRDDYQSLMRMIGHE